MLNKKISFSLFILIILGIVSSLILLPTKTIAVEKNYVEGELLVKYKKNVVNLKTTTGRMIAQSIISSKSLKKKRDLIENNISLLKITDNKTVNQKIAELRKDPRVEYAEPNYYRKLFITPNDTYFNLLWGLHNTQDADIDAPEAWNIATSSEIIIAIVDSGIDYRHSDLASNMWDGSKGCKDPNGTTTTCPYHGWDTYGSGDNNPLDHIGHGTHVAGIIGAVGNNGIGVVGVNWKVKLMAVKFFPDSPYGGGTLADELEAINFAKLNGAKIINASYGGSNFSNLEREAIKNFPGLFIAAAGNRNPGKNHDAGYHTYPCDHTLDNIICVAATDSNDNLASFSDYGRISVDVGAPGKDIYSTFLNNSYKRLSGTSMAAPYVSGLAGLIWGSKPELRRDEVKSRILTKGDAKSSLAYTTVSGKRINAYKSLTSIRPGDVIINEIMWAGSSKSPDDEWIELRNLTNSNVNLDGWTIENASGNHTALAISSSKCSTTILPANGYYLISNFTAENPNSILAITPQCVLPEIDLSDNYSTNGALLLKDSSGTIIDQTPTAYTSAWPAGTNASPHASMSRNFPNSGSGQFTSSWHTANRQKGFDLGVIDKGTPGSPNSSAAPTIISSEVSATSIKLVFDTTPLNKSTVFNFNNYTLESPSGKKIVMTDQNQWISTVSDHSLGQETIFIFGLELTPGATYSLSVSGITTQDGKPMTPYSTTGTVAISTDPRITDISVGAAISGSSLTFRGINFGTRPGTHAQIKFIQNGNRPLVLPATSKNITAWSNTSVTITVPNQAYTEETLEGPYPLSPGNYSINIRTDNWRESQFVKFIIATTSASYIQGKVTYRGSGKENIDVYAYIPGQPLEIPSTQSTVNGRYALGPITTPGNYKVKAKATGYTSNEVEVQITATPIIHTAADLILSPLLGKITGTVTYSGSSSHYVTTSVEVAAFNLNSQGEPPYVAKVKPDGTYEIVVPYGTFRVKPYINKFTSTPNYRTVEVREGATTSSGNNFTMTELTSYIQGTIFRGTGTQYVNFANVRVEAFTPGSIGRPYETNSDTYGRYTLYVPPKSYLVRVRIPGYGTEPSFRIVNVNSNVPTVGVNFTILSYPATLSGTVKDMVGNPIADAGVFAQKVGDEYGGIGTKTDSSGNYLLGFTSTSTYKIFVNPPFGSGYLRPKPAEVKINSGSNSQDFFLAKGAKTIQVKVMLGNSIRTDAIVNAFKEGEPGQVETREQTNGIYNLKVGGGKWRVTAFPQNPNAGWIYMGEPYPVGFSADSTTEKSDLITLKVTAADATVTGVVYHPNGSTPIIQGGVDIRNQEGIGAHSALNERGEFTVKVPAGTYNINVFSPDKTLTVPAFISEPFTISSGETKDFGKIIMVQKQATITGTVTSNYSRLAGIRIQAHKIGTRDWVDTVTNAYGNYTLYVTSGYWEVIPDPIGSDYLLTTPPKRVTVSTNTSRVGYVNFSLVRANATIKGRIVSDGKVVTSLFGYAFAYNSTVSNGGPINNGTFSIKVPAGSYKVGVGFLPNSNYILDAEQEVTVSSGGTANLDISVSQVTAYLTGQVKDDAGNNLPADAFVKIFATNDKGAWREAKTTVSNRVHSYTLSLTPGKWSIGYRIDSPDYINEPLSNNNFTVGPGTTTKNITVLKADATIQGKVYKPDGTAMPHVFVFADSSLAGQVKKIRSKTETKNDGTYTLKVKAGTYKVGAGLPPGFANYINPEFKQVTVASGATATVNLIFKNSNASIKGTVYSGWNPHKAFVWAWSDKGGYSETFTLNGSYTLNVNDNDIWHIGAANDEAEKYYEASEVEVKIPSGETSITQKLALVYKGYKPKSQTVTFDATTMQVIKLPDGTKIQIPAGSLASSGNVTVSVVPILQIARQRQARPIGLAYQITAVNSEGQTLTGPFNPQVVISLPYTDAQLSALGLTPDDLKVSYWSTANKMWQNIDSITVDTINKVIIFSVNHFTYYGITYSEIIEEGDTTPPVFSGAISASTVDTSKINITWSAATDNVDDSSEIIYNIYRSITSGGQNYSSPTYTTTAGATFYQATGLSCGTTYYFVVRAKDTSGNEDTNTVEVSATTEACPPGGGDQTPPTISQISVTPGRTSVTITWKTNEPSISWLVYGTSSDYNFEVKTTTYHTYHWVTLSTLTPGTTYHYQIKSRDSSGNIGSYTDKTFTTLGEAPSEGEIEGRPIKKITVEELQAKIAELMKQVTFLRAELARLRGETIYKEIPTGFTFQTNLRIGMRREEIKYLQLILNSDPDTQLAKTGVGSPGKETTYFGPLTKAAVIKFQEKYREEILAPWRLTRGTGYVGKNTRAKLNALLGK